MANSRFEYVKSFESEQVLLPNTWIVIRLDGKGFHGFTKAHGYAVPNDKRGISLMNACAEAVMNEFRDIEIAYGVSDEFSFVFRKSNNLFGRRRSKLESYVCSLFASSFVFHWPTFFPTVPLQYPPMFDARAVCYPSLKNIRDYLSWRQADCHINNLYNTTFWALVKKGGMKNDEAELALKGTLAADKNETLFAVFGINYSAEPAVYRKGSILFRDVVVPEDPPVNGHHDTGVQGERETGEGASQSDQAVTARILLKRAKKRAKREKKARKFVITTTHDDIIKDAFWKAHEWLLTDE